MARLREGRQLRAGDVARTFEVSLRTAYRDLDFLRDEWRVPLEFDRDRGTFCLTEPTALVTPVTLSRGEVVAVFFAERVLAQYRGTPFEADLASAFRKIQELLPEEVSVTPETLDAVLSLDLGPTSQPDAQVFADLLTGLQCRRATLIRYHSLSSGRTRDRRVHPYHVFNHRGDWYVAAWDEVRREVRDFALHRIKRITHTTQSFLVPSDFDPKRYLAQAFSIEKGARQVDVVIRFGPRQSRWIRERRWHRSARIQSTLDGGCILRFTASGLAEIRRWVMQFGAEAEVLSPSTLRTQVTSELKAALAAYASGRRPAKSPDR